MGALGNNLGTWLPAISLFVFLFDFIRGKGLQALKLSDLSVHKVPFAGLALGAGALFALSHMLGLALTGFMWPFFLGLTLCFLVSSLEFSYKSKSLLLLSATALFEMLVDCTQAQSNNLLVAYVIGLLAWKTVANFLNPQKAIITDVAMSVLYLSGQIFCLQTFSGKTAIQSCDIVSSAFIAAVLVNWFQRPFRADDKWLLKRFMLSATGGLIFLCLVTKVVMAPQYSSMAILLAAGFAFNFVLDGQGFKPGTSTALGALDLVRNILVVGCITLLATRLYGNLGLTVVGAGASIAFFSQAPAVAALFIASRLLEQTFGVAYVANVTGVNLLHPYVSAAQYFGFFTAVAVMLLLKEGKARHFDTIAMTFVGVVVPALVNFFLHAEASGSYLIALSVASLMLALGAQKFFAEDENNLCASIILLPAQASAIALYTFELLDMGTAASNPERLKIIYILAAIVAVTMIVSWFRNKSAAQPVVVAGE
jgi:hypothetical protein